MKFLGVVGVVLTLILPSSQGKDISNFYNDLKRNRKKERKERERKM